LREWSCLDRAEPQGGVQSDAEQLPAGIYSVGLAILLFTVLQNFLLAIVGDAYAAVRS
jgi:hypothetical protein